MLVEQFVTQASIEALDEAVLLEFARRYIMPCDTLLLRPAEHRTTGELRAVVVDHHFRLASVRNDPIKLPNEQLAGHRYVSEEAYAFAGAYIHDSQDPEPTNISQLVRHKVERPAFVQNQRLHQRCPHAYSPFTAAEMANRQLFLSVKPEKLLAVHDIPFSPRLDKNPPITCVFQCIRPCIPI